MRRFSAFATAALALVLSTRAQSQDTVFVSLAPQPGPGRISTGWRIDGPAVEPLGGQPDLSNETLRGVPDTLSDLDVRFLDFQWQLLLSDAYADGRIDSADYYSYHDPTVEPETTDLPFDQHVQYAVGRDRDGNFVVVFDTDNDEDLSDEKPVVFPWDGPPITDAEFMSQVHSTRDYLEQVGSLPSFPVSFQLYDDGRIDDAMTLISIAPHLSLPRPSSPDGPVALFPAYMIGAYVNMVGTAVLGGKEYTFWAGPSRELGVYADRSAQLWFEAGDTRATAMDSTHPFSRDPYLIGQVIDVEGQYYRLDHITLNGSSLRLVKVDNMPGVGIRAGQDAPEFRTVSAEGDAISLSDYRGKYVLLDFWSTSCGPCLADLPDIKHVYGAFDRSKFDVIGIAQDERTWLLKFVADNDIPWPQITQSQASPSEMQLLDSYRVTGIPTYFLVDPEGKIVDRALGLRPSQLESTLGQLMGE